MSRLALFLALSVLLISPLASADIPRLISLQGRLTDASDNPITSSANFAFRIYDAPAGSTALWTEFQTLSPNSLGIFSALLGSVATLNIPFNTSYWLEVQVNSEVLSPRQRMGSAGYALRSENPWNATGNDIYATNAGNVGIGTSSPSEKLDVVGTVKAASFKGDGSQLTGIQGVPSGAVMFFNLASCPSGWTEIASARGRYVVGLPASGTLAGTIGTALTDLEDRTHTHTGPSHRHDLGQVGTMNGQSLPAGGTTYQLPYYSDGKVTALSGTGSTGTAATSSVAPYIQLLVCQKS